MRIEATHDIVAPSPGMPDSQRLLDDGMGSAKASEMEQESASWEAHDADLRVSQWSG